MTPLDWVAEDLDVGVREIVKAFVVAPVLLAAFCVVVLFLWLMTPIPPA